jgi:hypothetical protein
MNMGLLTGPINFGFSTDRRNPLMALAEDKKTIIEILLFVGQLLDRLVKELPKRIPDNERQSFEIAWREVELRLREAISQIERIQSEENALWRTLRERGLTGAQLQLKRERLDNARKHTEKKRKGLWGRVLKLINSILGSLGVIPGIDQVKEFKEMIEDAQEE